MYIRLEMTTIQQTGAIAHSYTALETQIHTPGSAIADRAVGVLTRNGLAGDTASGMWTLQACRDLCGSDG